MTDAPKTEKKPVKKTPKKTPRISAAARRAQIVERARGCCEYCRSQQSLSHDDFAVEHIRPRAEGGTEALDNLALSCQACNNRKFTATHAIDPLTGESAPLFHPRQQLNRAGLVNYRRAMRVAGKHPPNS